MDKKLKKIKIKKSPKTFVLGSPLTFVRLLTLSFRVGKRSWWLF